MEHASSETVLGDFDNAIFVHFDDTTRFFRRDSSFFVSTPGPTGVVDTFEVRYTFGYRPLQQYLIPFEDGRLQALTVAWDTEQEQWFSLYPDENVAHDDWLHWTGGGMNWNHMCADCHSTNLQKNYDLSTDTYATTYSEIDVSCEACHGPGSDHVEWAREAEEGTEAPPHTGELGLNAKLHAQQEQVQTCAPCHSRRRSLAPGFVPGESFLDHYAPELLEEDLYFADGQIRDEVFVYGSFLQSEMYQQGVRCSDCHDPHSTRLKVEGNALCTQCHAAPIYDVPDHLRHEPESEGAECVDCHMPLRTYMVIDPRRDHSFKIPRPDLTVDLDVPNACNGCHADRSAEWARDYVNEWYGPERTGRSRFARAFAAGREGRPEGGPALVELVEERTTAPIVRATAVELLATYDSGPTLAAARGALRDAEPLVRAAAVRTLEARLEPGALVAPLAPLLKDSVRLVRIEAARVLALTEQFDAARDEAHAEVFRQALEEYVQSQQLVADQAGTHVNLAVLHESIGTFEEAEVAYRTALRLDSSFVPAHLNLAMLYSRQRSTLQQSGRHTEADTLRLRGEARLRAALRHEPALADAHYMLGLLLAEDTQDLAEAAEHLTEAARLAPDKDRIQYNAGLAHQHLGRDAAAERFLLNAYRLTPDEPDYLNALSIFYVQRERWDEALTYTRRLAERVQGAGAIQQRLQYIRQQMN